MIDVVEVKINSNIWSAIGEDIDDFKTGEKV